MGNASEAENGEYERAIRDYTEVIRLRPADSAAYYWRAKAYAAMGESYRALLDFSEAATMMITGPNIAD